MSILEVSAEQYHADVLTEQPTLSASIARILVSQTPAHARAQHPRLNPDFNRGEETKFDLGSAAHRMLLEGEDAVHVVYAPDWRSNFAKEQRDFGRAQGRIPLLESQYTELCAMCDALRQQISQLEADPPVFTGGKPEQTLVWEEQGVACRARLDWLRDDYTAIDDLKTTAKSADPFKWGQHTLFGMGYDVQCAMYRRAVRAVTGAEPDFRFIVVETAAPYACSVVALAPDALALADSKLDYALSVWRRCLETDRWEAYDKRVAYATAPAWAEANWFERVAILEEAA